MRAAMIRVGAGVLVALSTAIPCGAQTTEAVRYFHTDALGSIRVVTDANANILARHDYTAFGDDLQPPAGTLDTPRFTGKERDPESGLDYFGARYYVQRSGRFTTVDPLGATRDNLVDPQRWNRYAYVMNNPLRYYDPNGRQAAEALDRDIRALMRGEITREEYNARIQARGVGHSSESLLTRYRH